MAGGCDQAERLFAEGETLADAGRDDEALARFEAAWAALPDPKEEQDPDGRVLAAVADGHFYLGNWNGCCAATPSRSTSARAVGRSRRGSEVPGVRPRPARPSGPVGRSGESRRAT